MTEKTQTPNEAKEQPKAKDTPNKDLEPIIPLVNGRFALTRKMLKNYRRVVDLPQDEKERMRQEYLKKYKRALVTIEVPRFLAEEIRKKKKNELYVITVAKKLLHYIVQVTDKAPKKYRFTFVNRLQNYGIDILENLFRANQQRTDIKISLELRKSYQKNAYTTLKLLSYISYMAYENKCLLEKHYINIADQVHECLNWLVQWMSVGKQINEG